MTFQIRPLTQGPADAGTGTAVVDDAAGKAAADRATADKAVADKAAADKVAADKLIADKAAADKAVADAGKTPEQIAAENASAEAAADAARAQPPAKYELTLPEGGRLDASDLKAVEDLARKTGWTNEQAQDAISEHAALEQVLSDQFFAETTADKDYGGDKLAQSQQLAKLVIDRIRPVGHPRREAFTKIITRGGLANHIEMVSFFADFGKLMAEDTATGGSSGLGGGGARDAATVLYGGTK